MKRLHVTARPFGLIFLALLVGAVSYWYGRPAKGDLTAAIDVFLRKHLDGTGAGMVVGVVDEYGTHVVSCGKLDNGSDQEVNGDAVFEIGSIGKTFTTLLLCDLVGRGEMKLDDPVAKYLPGSVRMPSRNGKEITLRHLATHYSGLPAVPDNLDAKRADNPYADYTVEKLYAFLSSYELTREPGAQSEYSNLGMGLLGRVIALKAGRTYEELVVDRICRPLQMESTGIVLPPELKARLVTAHNPFGEAVPHWEVAVLEGAGALRSTVNDLLKYVSANAGLTSSALTPSMKQAHEQWLAWQGEDFKRRKIVGHAGGTAGCSGYIGFDQMARRGVVVLSNRKDFIDVQLLGTYLLKSDWRSLTEISEKGGIVAAPRKPRSSVKLSGELLDAYVGEYDFAPNLAAQLPGGMKVRVWRQGDQLLAEARGKNVLQGAFEIYPESETVFFDRISGVRSIFRKADKGTVVALMLSPEGQTPFEGRKISNSSE
jgi:serine-type D-Ala-D-Ala carboxypeptidase/endopeptidase